MNTDSHNTVLVVDDAPDTLSLVNDTLEKAGIDTLVALEGRQALTIAAKVVPDLILLDASMPVMDGFETCRNLKADEHTASIPVIFMTGLADTDSIVRGLDAGGVDYLTKPVNPQELLARMKVHMSNARKTRSAYKALNSAGQYMFTVNRSGELLWATPQTYGLFQQSGADGNWLEASLSPLIRKWLKQLPVPGQSLPIPDNTLRLRIVLADIDDDECLMKAYPVHSTSDEDRLRDSLTLTQRESQVLYWLANGKSNREIAEILGIGVRTVHKHLEQVYPKLGVENRTSAVGIALRVLA